MLRGLARAAWRGGGTAQGKEDAAALKRLALSELPAPELASLSEAVLEEQHRRTGEPIPEQVVGELRTSEFEALRELVLGKHDRRTADRNLSPALA